MPKKPTTPPDTKDNIVVSASKVTDVAPKAPPHAKTAKKGKLPKKHKHRLPRRQKKAQQRAQASHQGQDLAAT
jgi:hypothetical protein